MERVSVADVELEELAPGKFLSILTGTASMSVQYFAFEPGVTVDEHRHDREQVGYVFDGGVLTFYAGDEALPCGPGDAYAIPGGQPHAAENESDETVYGVEIHSPPRERPGSSR